MSHHCQAVIISAWLDLFISSTATLRSQCRAGTALTADAEFADFVPYGIGRRSCWMLTPDSRAWRNSSSEKQGFGGSDEVFTWLRIATGRSVILSAGAPFLVAPHSNIHRDRTVIARSFIEQSSSRDGSPICLR
jgi:hypothetical protein